MGVLRERLGEIKGEVMATAAAADTEIKGLEAEVAALAPALDAALAPIPAQVAKAKVDIQAQVKELIASIEALNT